MITGPPVREPFADAGDESIIASLAIFSRELLRRMTTLIVDGGEVPVRRVSAPLPFSRAAAKDYVRLVSLWTAYRTGSHFDVPARPCPACRTDDSDFLFFSYDQYPYHACRKCGTWFVPMAIDDGIIQAFFSAVPEARRIADGMMVGRDVLTRDSDRDRIGHYFRMMEPLLGDRTEPIRYLDVGCGVGHSVELAAELGWQATGVELSEVAVATARAKGRNVVPVGTDARGATYDVVSLFETLEHITDPDPVLAAAVRALAPLGLVIVTVPNRASFEISILRDRCFHVFGGVENVGHINLFDHRGIAALLERHGLSVMFTDGQFSSDFAQVFSHLTTSGQTAIDVMAKGQLDFAIAEPAYAVLNNLGPAFARLERVLKRSPILIAVACRTEDRRMLVGRFAAVESNRRRDVHRTIADDGQALLVFENEYKATVAAMQDEIHRRDDLLQEAHQTASDLQRAANDLQHQIAAAQDQINLRDDLLSQADARFQRTIDARVARLARSARRLVRRT